MEYHHYPRRCNPRKHSLTCHACGKPFFASRCHAETCSPTCRKRCQRRTSRATFAQPAQEFPDPPCQFHEYYAGPSALLAAAWLLPKTNPARARLINQANAAEASRRRNPITRRVPRSS